MTASWNDFNDAQSTSIIPKGVIVKARAVIRPGGYGDPAQGWTGGYATRGDSGALLRRMVGAVVVDQVRRITGKQDRLLVVHDADDVIRPSCYHRTASGDRRAARDRPGVIPGSAAARG